MSTPAHLTYNLSEAAEAVNVSRPTMAALAKTEGFPAFRVGPRYLIPIDALNEWLIKQAEERREFIGLNEPKLQ